MTASNSLFRTGKKTFILAAAVALALAACTKEEEPLPDPAADNNDTIVDPDPESGLAGDYGMTIVYDSVCSEGNWIENGYMGIPNLTYADEHGRMRVTAVEPGTLRIEGTTVYSNNEEENTFFTTATRNADGTYTAQPSSYRVETVDFSVSYRPLSFHNDTLQFQVVETFEMGGVAMAYLRTITCTK